MILINILKYLISIILFLLCLFIGIKSVENLGKEYYSNQGIIEYFVFLTFIILGFGMSYSFTIF